MTYDPLNIEAKPSDLLIIIMFSALNSLLLDSASLAKRKVANA